MGMYVRFSEAATYMELAIADVKSQIKDSNKVSGIPSIQTQYRVIILKLRRVFCKPALPV